MLRALKESRDKIGLLSGLLLISLFNQGCTQYWQSKQYGVDSVCYHSLAIQLPAQWIQFDPILCTRLTQPQQKMKLTKNQVNHFVGFLWSVDIPVPELFALSKVLPKTTLELLRSVELRGVSLSDAEDMAKYLVNVPELYSIHNIAFFDENTSHIIGRQWHEIDYSDEGLSWQQQQKTYAAYDITNFKSVANLKKFFQVESTLPYFKEAYQ
ncbi:hypothetical protein [uncultured Shewanella sp.]|uniref:hypothetical protein n=1 Tax=uncultured Shewanella sp. TaxID=173975 RepID=UPI00260F28F8|nr:hypothetical protein [uncultured Shewanella sp.]